MSRNNIKTEYREFKKQQKKRALHDTPNEAAIKIELLKPLPQREQAMACFLYLTGARVGEMVKAKRKDLAFENLSVNTEHGKKIMKVFIVTLHTEKNKKQKIRRVANLKERNLWVIRPIIKYAGNLAEEDLLFPFSTRHIRRLNWKWFNFNPHHWRHIRNTHLIGKFGWSVEKRMKYFGWSDPRSAQSYDHTNWKEAVG